ncbi:DsbA family protein [Nocardioides sp. TRM66260-LWL]|uniref:DsbA family protein n=1 Tax=Nocardioides sp. TRM66260-LWL TaxID=2874478 RepID=UPI001CC448F2|nr:thioredoxin domain-containing protein [Nocardioides sp. TRM66260-LWL]MBZ5732983.1 DsbA family protein [Nocardioides sp. TRM66260-LWL]
MAARSDRSDRPAGPARPGAGLSPAARRRRAINLATLACVLVLVVGVAYLVTRSSGPGPVNAPPAGQSRYGVTLGEASAPHSVVVYEDFLCPFCRQFEEATETELARLAEEGKVYVEYRPFVLLSKAGDYSARSLNAFAVVKRAAGDAVALRFHDLLYAQQPDERGPFPDDDWLVARAVEAGAQEDAVRPGIEGRAEQSFVDGATKEAQDSGVQSTPSVLLDGTLQTGRTVDDVVASVLGAVR